LPQRGLTPQRAIRGVRRRIRLRADCRAAVRQASAFAASHTAPVRVCWDLDNTLVASGRLLHTGTKLDEAVRVAEPLEGMLEFHSAVSDVLSAADHFFLSARAAAMRADTLAWLARHQLDVPPTAICLVPTHDAKPAVWRRLARGARLLVVDDLTRNHESGAPQPYESLTRQAAQIADSYVGAEIIGGIAADPSRARAVAERVAAELTAGPG
jgi:hypothetical protein